MNYNDAIKVITPEQYNQLIEIIEKQIYLSQTGCIQTIELIFKAGKLRWINASNNASADGVMDDDYQWHSDKLNQ
jgi:hypothetical protein